LFGTIQGKVANKIVILKYQDHDRNCGEFQIFLLQYNYLLNDCSYDTTDGSWFVLNVSKGVGVLYQDQMMG
jgi:hypothetical protein